jgi:hypothetical protein
VNELNVLKELLESGHSISYKRLTVCKITRPFGKHKNVFQVHCEDSSFKHSQLYFDVESAIITFCEHRQKLVKKYKNAYLK